MKKIHLWAARHPHASRAIIALGHVLLTMIGFEAGLQLFRDGIQLGVAGIGIASLLLLGAVLIYPQKRFYQGRQWLFLRRRFRADVLLLLTGVLMGISVFNYSISKALSVSESVAGYRVVPAAIHNGTQHSDEQEVLSGGKEIKKDAEWRKSLRKEIKAHYLQQEKEKGKTGYYILLFLMASVLSLGLAGLSCNIACSGSGAVAIFVAIAGIAGIVLLTAWLLRKLLPEDKKKKAAWIAVLFLLGGVLFWLAILSV